MASTRQDKKGLAKIATIVALSLLLALSPFVGGCPGEPDPVEVEPIEVVPDPVEVEPIIVKPMPGPTNIVAEANFEAIDQHALATPESVANTVESLAAWLVEPARNDLETVRAIFRWITDSIYYDIVSYFNIIEGTGPVGDQSPEAVLDSRKAVCEGYSRLFKALAHFAGLEVVQVTGWVKGFGYPVEGLTEEPNHAWNAVKINDGWYLLDSTWGAGGIDEEGQFVREFEEFYFLTPPDQFIYSHFPINPDWQLLEVPVTKDEFAKLPQVWPGFFEKNLEFVSHPGGIIEVEHSVVVTISAPEDVQLSVRLEQDDQRLPRTLTFVQREGEYYVIEAVFPGPGDYSLIIFAGKRGEAEELESVIEYTVKVSKGLPGPIGFPLVWPGFFEKNLEFVSHPGGIIEVEHSVVVTISAPEDVQLSAEVEQDSQRLPRLTFVQREGEYYVIEAVFPGPGDYSLIIFAGKRGEAELWRVIEYTVKVSKGLPGPIGFPETYRDFREEEVYLYSPKAGYLQSGSIQLFKLRVPRAESVAVIAGNEWHHLVKRGSLFEGRAPIVTGEIMVAAKFPDREHYTGLLGYTGL
ncbi:hypothetical protein M1O20_05560 [Dehalococcoidia bacterium]|nr:hypothetical protein [Dehalococcoidia bacterium]